MKKRIKGFFEFIADLYKTVWLFNKEDDLTVVGVWITRFLHVIVMTIMAILCIALSPILLIMFNFNKDTE